MHYRRCDRATVFWPRCFSVPPLTMHDPPWPICKGWDLHRAPWRGFFCPEGCVRSYRINDGRRGRPLASSGSVSQAWQRGILSPLRFQALSSETLLLPNITRLLAGGAHPVRAARKRICVPFLRFFWIFFTFSSEWRILFSQPPWGTPPCKSSKNSSAPPA